jgi:hypothetical protein
VNARLATVAVLLVSGCAPQSKVAAPKPDPTREAGYTEAVGQLVSLNQKARDLVQRGRPDDAAAAITEGQPLQARLLAAPQPTLAAMEAVSDLDDLYARMLLSNHNDGWARMLFQKNIVRWKSWPRQTPETARRLEQARQGAAECDRRLAR